MRIPSPEHARSALALIVAALVLLASGARADKDRHAAQDAFDAEVAALLPPAVIPMAKATAPAERKTLGEWSAIIPWTPHIPVSAATLPDGRVLTFASNQRTTFPAGPEFTYAATWNPATGQFVEYNHPSHDMFCGALVMLPDGRVLVNGGRNTTVRSSIFDWRNNTWTRTPDMNDPRWYNTSVALPNGRVWTVSGSGGSGTAERWDQSIGWSRLTGINWNLVTSEPGYIQIWHPFLLLAPDGRLIHFGPTDTMHWVSPDGSGAMSNTGTFVPGTHYPKEGAWVMYDEGRILVAGGGANTTANPSDTTTGTSTTTAYTVDVRGAAPVVTPAASMRFARQFANSVVLPNGEVMVIGGNTSGLKFNDTGSILTPEIWNPLTGQWRIAADANVPRNYHSLALLLPDGRVLSGGGGLGGADHRDAQIFTPPNLFNADGTLATRPVLNSAPPSIGVGTRFVVNGTAGIQKFSFIKMSAITHSVNTDLRYLSLPFTETSPGVYEVTAHSSLNVMTPGYWMLFAIDKAGVHSVSKIVLVDATTTVDVVTPGNQASHVGQSVSLQVFGSGPTGSILNWSATGLPDGLTLDPSTGLITGAPTQTGSFAVRVTLSNGNSSDSVDFNWVVQPATFSRSFSGFSGASGLTLNGNATTASGPLRLTANTGNQAGSAFLTDPIALGPDSSISARFVFRIHGTADGADGLTFVIQGNGPTSLGAMGGGLGYDGMTRSVAVEIDNYAGASDPNANHLGILSNGSVATHLATFIPGWDLENGSSHTVWVEYDGPANVLRVFAAQGNVTQRPAAPVMTTTIDLSAMVGGQAWFGFTAATGGAFNNHDIESWSLTVNAFALPAQPVIATVSDKVTVLGVNVTEQMQATDANGDLLTWGASGLPPGLTIDPASGLITGSPTAAGSFNPVITVTDGNTPPVNASFQWTIEDVLTVQPLSGRATAVGTTVSITANAVGGLNRQYRWSFGDGTPETPFSSSPTITHQFSAPGRYLVTVTVRDETGREVTSSYRQAIHAPLTAARPTASSSIAYESRPGLNARLWTVNPDNDSVTVFDANTRSRLAEINVGRGPRTLAIGPDGRVWVANTESASLTLLNPDYSTAKTVALPRGSRPFGIVFDPAGANAYVALEEGGKILKLNPDSGATVSSLEVGLHVRHLSIAADGSRLLATRFVTPRLPGEDTAIVQTSINGTPVGAEVLSIDSATFSIEGTIVLQHSEEPDTSNSGKGIPNYLGAAVISPDGSSAWVPSKQDNIKRGTLRSGSVLTHDMAMRSIASRIDLATRAEDLDARIDFDNAGIASASAFSPDGVFLFTALEGSREIAVSDAWAKEEIMRFDAGRAPQGLAVSPDGLTLYVQNFTDRSITVHDLASLMNGSSAPLPAPAVLSCVSNEKLSGPVLRGKQLFYDTRDTRVAFQQYISCASCHNDGGQDGRVWDFTQFGEGLRNTITLRGRGGMAHGPLHWTGNFDEVQDFEGQIRGFALGTGLMNDGDFHAGTRSQPIGDAKAGLSEDLDALAAYVASLASHGDSPHRNADGTFTAAAQAGRLVFQQQNCAQCHSGPAFTDSALGVFHDVGTIKPSSGGRLAAALTGLDTPTVLGLWSTAPYLHDGSAATIEEAVAAHAGVNLSGEEMSNLAAFLRQLDDVGTAPVPATIAWNNPSAISYGTPLGAAQLNAQANVAGTFTYSPAAGTVLHAGNAQVLSVTFTPDDTNNFAPASATVIIDVSKALLTVKAENRTKIYGAPLPSFSASYSGFVNGDTPAALDVPISFSTAAAAGSPVGAYSIQPVGGSDADYEIVRVDGTLTITPAPLTITAADKTRSYGAANPPLTVTYAGFVNGDSPAQLDTLPSLSTTATGGSSVGTYTIAVSGGADVNYTVTRVNGTLTITPASLTIRADDKTRAVGEANPPFTATYTGFVNGDSPAALDSPVVLASSANQSSPDGSYAITATGAVDANYTITHINGVLTVTPDTELPAPWLHRDIGSVGIAGDARHSSGTFTVSGSGADIWNSADGFHFVYQPWTGNAEIVARVTSIGNTDPWAKSGVMIRESLAAGARHAMMVVTPGNGSAFQYRTAANAASTHIAGPAVTAPYWVRLVRLGNTIEGYVSANGTSWTFVGSVSISLPSAVLIGLPVTAHNNAAMNTSTFTGIQTKVAVAPPPAAPASLTATAASGSQINLAWTPGSANQSGFRIERSLDGLTFTPIANVASTARSYSNTGLSAGTTYHYRVAATNAYGISPYSPVAAATTPTFAVKINFQPSSAAVPSGYRVDSGSSYGSRSGGYTYGWNRSNGNAVDRNSSRSPDQRYDTLNLMQPSGSSRTWEIAVPNGTYNVFVVAGDANNYNSVYRINVEGVLTVSGTPTSANRWLSGSKTVTVKDGRLTVSNGSGASNNKICFIDITQAKSGSTSLAQVASTSLAIQWIRRESDGRILLRVTGAEPAACELQSSADLKSWVTVPAKVGPDGTITITGSPAGEQQFYRARLLP